MKNKQVKVRGKIRILDVVIILLILASFVGIYFRYNIMDTLTGAKNLKDYTVSFEIKDVRYTTEAYFNIGDKFKFADDGSEFGVLIEASDDSKNALIVVPSVKTFIPADGDSIIEIPYPENTRIDASGRLNCRGSYSEDSGFLVGGKRHISAGDRILINTEIATVEIEILDIFQTEI